MASVIQTTSRVFFDSAKLKGKLTAEEKKIMSRAGSFIRRTARQSMKKAGPGDYSKPGEPPHYHKGGFNLRNRIFFAYEIPTHSVVVGPDVLANKIGPLHEFGGVLGEKSVIKRMRERDVGPIRLKRTGKLQWTRIESADQWRRAVRLASVFYGSLPGKRRYKPRPFMGPAFEKEIPKFPDLWKNSVKP